MDLKQTFPPGAFADAARHSPSWATAALQTSRSPFISSVASLSFLVKSSQTHIFHYLFLILLKFCFLFCLHGGGQMQCFGDLIAMEGTNANEPCRIGSIRPRRQARERRSLQPSKSQVPSGKTMASMLQMCLPLVRNQLLTTSTPRLKPVHHV